MKNIIANWAWRSLARKKSDLRKNFILPTLHRRIWSGWVESMAVLLCFTLFIAGSRISAQITDPNSKPAVPARLIDSQASRDPNAPALQARHPRYRVMPSDILAISFPLSPEINQTVTIQPDGFITLANLGSFYVQGQTAPEIVGNLTKAYAKILHDPIIAVDITNFQAPQFTVNGQVGKPGQYPLRIDTTVSEGVAVAGGFLPTAKTQVFLFHRVSTDWVEVKKLNLKELLRGKKVDEDVLLQAGDMIFVPEKLIATFRKYVPYGTGMYFNPSSVLF